MCMKDCRHGQEVQLFFRPHVRIGKKFDLWDFDRGMVQDRVDRQSGLSISETTPGIFTHISLERAKKHKQHPVGILVLATCILGQSLLVGPKPGTSAGHRNYSKRLQKLAVQSIPLPLSEFLTVGIHEWRPLPGPVQALNLIHRQRDSMAAKWLILLRHHSTARMGLWFGVKPKALSNC